MAAHLEAHRELDRRQPCQALGIDAQRIVPGIAAEGAIGEHVEARHRQPLGAHEGLSGRGLAVGPQATRTGVEEHRHDGKIDAPARHFFRWQTLQPFGQPGPAVPSAGLEMPPARMEGDRRRIAEALARDRERGLHGRFQSCRIERKPRRASVLDIFQNLRSAFADCGRRSKIGDRVDHSSSPRPFGRSSSLEPGLVALK